MGHGDEGCCLGHQQIVSGQVSTMSLRGGKAIDGGGQLARDK